MHIQAANRMRGRGLYQRHASHARLSLPVQFRSPRMAFIAAPGARSTRSSGKEGSPLGNGDQDATRALAGMAPQERPVSVLLPIMAVVSIGFLVIGLALPVLPLHVHQGLGLSTFVVGLVAGAQFGASLLSRFWAGHFADSRGAKRATVTGLLVAAVAGLLYSLSLGFVRQPGTSVTVLLLGRAVLGGAESFIVTGAFTWGLALAGPQNTGQIMAWIGTAVYAAFAIGAPAGTALYAGYGFAAIALATTLIPLVSLLLVAPRR